MAPTPESPLESEPAPRVKICCIASIAEAALAIRYGASAIGLVSAMPSGPGPIPEQRIAEVAAWVPPGIATFLLTSLADVDDIIDQQRRMRTNTVQLVDRLERGSIRDLRDALPGIAIVQVIHVIDENAVDDALLAESDGASAVLLDSGNPLAAVKELGGTGRVHDWDVSRRVRDALSVPVYLAGGLRPDNVFEAARRVRPFGVDVCSGLRTAGHLDEAKVRGFFDALRLRSVPTAGPA